VAGLKFFADPADKCGIYLFARKAKGVATMRILLVLVALLAGGALPGCSMITDFGIKAGQGVEVNPFNLGSGDSVFSPANDRGFANGDPQDCRTHR
jgi:hypothetical protein